MLLRFMRCRHDRRRNRTLQILTSTFCYRVQGRLAPPVGINIYGLLWSAVGGILCNRVHTRARGFLRAFSFFFCVTSVDFGRSNEPWSWIRLLWSRCRNGRCRLRSGIIREITMAQTCFPGRKLSCTSVRISALWTWTISSECINRCSSAWLSSRLLRVKARIARWRILVGRQALLRLGSRGREDALLLTSIEGQFM